MTPVFVSCNKSHLLDFIFLFKYQRCALMTEIMQMQIRNAEHRARFLKIFRQRLWMGRENS
jgi:hypothetical protein